MLTALGVATVLLAGFVFGFSRIQSHQLAEDFALQADGVSQHFRDNLQEQQRALGAILAALLENAALGDALAARNRETLLRLSEPLFHRLHDEYAVTHFYFTDPDRVNLLRVHQPSRHGDTIDRATTLAAASTGRLGAGLEMGPLGTLTLRVVAAWRRDDRLLGYLELGMEVEHLVAKLPPLFGYEGAILLEKTSVTRSDWEDGMRMLGREPHWDAAPHQLVAFSTLPDLYRKLGDWRDDPAAHTLLTGGHSYRTTSTPIDDVMGRPVAQLLLLSRIDTQRRHEAHATLLSQWLYVALGGGMAVVILLLLRWSDRRMRTSQRDLDQARMEWAEAFDAVADPIFLHDAELRLLHVNRAYAELAGESAEDLRGRPYWIVFPLIGGGLASCRAASCSTVDPTAKLSVREEEIVLDDGRTFNSRAYPVQDPHGVFLYSIHILHDITQQKQADEQLRLTAVAFDNTAEGIIITDDQANICAVNRAFTAITGYSAQEATGRNPAFLQSDHHDPAFYSAMWLALQQTGHWQGEIWNCRKDGAAYPEWLSISSVRTEQGTLSHYVGVFADLSDIRQTQHELNHLVHHDPLTGLPNRLLLTDRLQHALLAAQREGQMVALVILSLDRFKAVNETLGHRIGDTVLTAIARRLQHALRAPDTLARPLVRRDDMQSINLARLSGDEFAVVLERIRSADDVAKITTRLLETIAEPISTGDGETVITASAGISLFPDDGECAERLLQRADTAAHTAKLAGGNVSHFFSAELGRAAEERFQLLADLRRGLAQQELVVYYQPQYLLRDSRLMGFEALVRWQHPTKGLVAPAAFIPAAEDSGLIVPLGQWVLAQACHQAALWQRSGRQLQVAVNVSPRQFHQPDLVRQVAALLHDTGLEPSRLELEITESCIMENAEETVRILDELKGLGVGLAVDDFGTGYSSLSYLKRFPVDKLKIDRSFVMDIQRGNDDCAITRAILALAHGLNLTTIAEGVETEAQRDLLDELGCEQMQGFLVGRPMPVEDIDELLAARD